jgi:uncharacterized protein (TIGR02147 family)
MRPFIFEYENYRDYLRDMMKWWSNQDDKYSLRWFSKRLGFSSPSMLSMSLSGLRTLQIEKLIVLTDALKLLADEVEYLRILYDLEQCNDERERERINTIKRNRFQGGAFKDLDPRAFELYAFWYLPAIRELVAFPDFKADPFWISGALGITPIEARDGFMTLMRIGQVVVDDGRYIRSTPSVQPQSPPGLVLEYTKTHIRKSADLFALDRSNRYANTLTIAISKETFEKIPEILARVIAEVDSLAEKDMARTDVAQLNVQFYSMTGLAEIEKGMGSSGQRTKNQE